MIDTDRINYLIRLANATNKIDQATNLLDSAWKVADPDNEITYKLYDQLRALRVEAEKKFQKCWKELLDAK